MEYQLLNIIDTPQDLKSLSIRQLDRLADEIRDYLVEVVSQTGGHLAPSLGVVELTIALHYVFNTPRDRLIWDVGHQAYVHKILTGRRERMDTLRQLGGLSGFPLRGESEHDHYSVGHSSTSLSLALGNAVSRDMDGKNYEVIPIIGDGAMTAGMAFEALNLIGDLQKRMIIILNDNNMSIAPNVGAVSRSLNRIIANPAYNRVKFFWYRFLHSIPKVGGRVSKIARRMECRMKHIFIPGVFFEEMGIRYIGPVDGHKLSSLVVLLEELKAIEKNGPILIHVITKKGMGYRHAEENAESFHGLGPFEKESGKVKKNGSKELIAYSKIFGQSILAKAQNDSKIVAITAAMREGTGLKSFSEKFPERFFDVGIAEQNAITFAASLASQGYKPYVTLYSTFLQRAYDQIIHDVANMNLPIKLIVDRAGVVGEDGPTHHGVFDTGFLRLVPNMVLMSPKDGKEMEAMLDFMDSYEAGPVAMRFPRGGEHKKLMERKVKVAPIQLGKAELLSWGKDVVLVSYGPMFHMGIQIRRRLRRKGYDVGLINLRFLKPLDSELINQALEVGARYVTLEDSSIMGGVAEAVSSALVPELRGRELVRLGYPDKFLPHGQRNEVMQEAGLSVEKAVEHIHGALLHLRGQGELGDNIVHASFASQSKHA